MEQKNKKPYEKDFLKDFETLIELTEEEKQKELYFPANLEKAKEQMANTYVLN